MEIWFGIGNGQISSILTYLSARDTSIFSIPDNNLSKSQLIFTQLNICIDIVEILFGIAIVYISSRFDRVIRHDMTIEYHETFAREVTVNEKLCENIALKLQATYVLYVC